MEDNRKTELNTLFCQLSSQGKAEFMDYLRNLEREQNEKKNDTIVSSGMQKL